MITLTKGYKQGRAVMFYDAFDELKNKEYHKVTKDEIVKFCENGLISNAKVQWWEGKAIVRVSTNIPLVKITDSGEVSIEKSVHKTNEKIVKPVQVINTNTKRRKKISEIDYSSYMNDEIRKQRELKSSVSFDGIYTVSELFDVIANDFRLRNTEKYKTSFSSKVNINKKLSELPSDYKNNLVSRIAIYLMNMSNIETQEIYLKYYNAG